MLKRLYVYGFALIICVALGACAASKKEMRAGPEDLKGPVYIVKVRTMLREEPTLDADATGVLAPGEEVYLQEFSKAEDWALITAGGTGDVVFKGWVRSDRMFPKDN